MPQNQSHFKENLEAIASFIQVTEGLFTSLATIITIGLLMFFNKVNDNNQLLMGTLTGGGLLYGSGSAAMSVMRRRSGDTNNIQANQAIVQQPMNENADAYLYTPSASEEAQPQPRNYSTAMSEPLTNKETYYLLSEHLPNNLDSKFDDEP